MSLSFPTTTTPSCFLVDTLILSPFFDLRPCNLQYCSWKDHLILCLCHPAQCPVLVDSGRSWVFRMVMELSWASSVFPRPWSWSFLVCGDDLMSFLIYCFCGHTLCSHDQQCHAWWGEEMPGSGQGPHTSQACVLILELPFHLVFGKYKIVNTQENIKFK